MQDLTINRNTVEFEWVELAWEVLGAGITMKIVDKQRWELEIIDIYRRMEENTSGYGGGWQMGQKSLTLSDNAVSFLNE